jgi:hypothetical protein
MRSKRWPAALAGLIAFFLLAGLVESGRGDEEKELREGLIKLAAAIEKKDDGEARKLVGDLSKKFDLEALMYMHQERSKGGLGLSLKPDEAKPDGIEKKVVALARKPLPPEQLNAEADALVHMGYRMAAIAEMTTALAPEKNKKAWLDAAADYKAGSLQLAEGSKAKKPDLVQQAAKKVDAICLKCHDTIR